MGKFGKWIGAGLGWTIGGPIGALVGFAFGTFVDTSDLAQFDSASQDTTTGDFVVSLLVLMAAVMKADKKVMQSELSFIKNYLVKAFGEDEAAEMLRILRDVLKRDIPLHDVSMQIRSRMDYASRLQLMHLLFGIALADGGISHSELGYLDEISAGLGISRADTDSIKNMFVKSTEWAYHVLEIKPSASDEEVRKTYRQMALKNHPDKVAYLGEEIRQKAQEKFQKISEAYETVKKERKMV
jgi:DnaJ like chaperone protein